MNPTADEAIALAYAAGPTDRACELFHMRQTCSSVLAAFVHPPDPVVVLVPSERPPFASPDSSLLPRLLDVYMPFIIREYSIDAVLDRSYTDLRCLHRCYLKSVYGDPDYGEPAFNVTELPEEVQKEIDEWVDKGGELCGFYLKPPVERLVDWLRGQDTQDDAHPYYCDDCHKYTTNVELPTYRNYCYLCRACDECGTCHCGCGCKDCSYNEVAWAALDLLYRENRDRR